MAAAPPHRTTPDRGAPHPDLATERPDEADLEGLAHHGSLRRWDRLAPGSVAVLDEATVLLDTEIIDLTTPDPT